MLVMRLGVAPAASVPPPVSLAAMIEKADFVFKATALSSEPSADPWFTSNPPRPAYVTRLRPIAWEREHPCGKVVGNRECMCR